jgi:hypothetical protein
MRLFSDGFERNTEPGPRIVLHIVGQRFCRRSLHNALAVEYRRGRGGGVKEVKRVKNFVAGAVLFTIKHKLEFARRARTALKGK